MSGSEERGTEWWRAYSADVRDAAVALVCDPFAGSLTTAAVAERLQRRWIAIEQSLTYLRGGVGRFEPDGLRVAA